MDPGDLKQAGSILAEPTSLRSACLTLTRRSLAYNMVRSTAMSFSSEGSRVSGSQEALKHTGPAEADVGSASLRRCPTKV